MIQAASVEKKWFLAAGRTRSAVSAEADAAAALMRL
jgi:hypothetical protein